MPEPYQILPKRGKDTSKNDYGSLLVLGGSVGYTGAPTLCARAAVRAGAGRVYLGVPESIYTITAVKNDEAMPFPLPDQEGKLSQDALTAIIDRMKKCDVTVFGPGLGRTEETFRLVRAVVRAADKPLVLDADAIFAVSRDLSLLDRAKAPIYLTPHDGEFMSLFGERAGRDRPAETTAFAKAHRCTVIRKGAETICARPDGRTVVLHADNPGMAKGGSGDVLAGILAALLGQGLTAWRAMQAACLWHGLAGRLAGERCGIRSTMAEDVIRCLGEAAP